MAQGIAIVPGNGAQYAGFNLPDEALQVTLLCSAEVQYWEHVCRVTLRSEDFRVRTQPNDSYNIFQSFQFVGPTLRFLVPPGPGGKRQIIFSRSQGIIREFEYTWYDFL